MPVRSMVASLHLNARPLTYLAADTGQDRGDEAYETFVGADDDAQGVLAPAAVCDVDLFLLLTWTASMLALPHCR